MLNVDPKDHNATFRRARSPYVNGCIVLIAVLVSIGWAIFWFSPPWWAR